MHLAGHSFEEIGQQVGRTGCAVSQYLRFILQTDQRDYAGEKQLRPWPEDARFDGPGMEIDARTDARERQRRVSYQPIGFAPSKSAIAI